MIGASVIIEDHTKRVAEAAERAAFRNFRHAGAVLSKDMKASLVTADGPSPEGEPPHTHRGAYLRRAVRFDADKNSAVIGPMASIVGDAGAAHEFGENFRGHDYPERSFAGPALERNQDRFASEWEGRIGE